METKKQLKSFFTEHWNYMAVSTACKLNIFDHLQQEKRTAAQLANDLSLNEEKLVFLLNALQNIGFLSLNGEYFKINSLSELLTEDNPEGLKYACLNWSSEHLNAWQQLDYSIKTGKSSFENIYGLPFFDYLNEHPDKLHAYHQAMYQYAKDDYKDLSKLIDFKKHKSVLDVGGSYGAVLENVKANNPGVECILFDLEKVVANVKCPKIKKIAGSFFDRIPDESDAIILSRILHDWDDEKAAVILKNCFESLPKSGTLYVIENCSDKITIDLSLLSLNMTAMCESYERTALQYISQCKNVGFQFEGEIQLNELQNILIFQK